MKQPPPTPTPTPSAARFRLTSGWIIAGLIALPLLVFWDVAAGLSSFDNFDLNAYFLPYHSVAAQIIRDGHLPLWNPYAFCGIPLLGDGQTALFFPLNWLMLVMPVEWGLMLGIVLRLALGGVGMYLLLRQLRFSNLHSAMGGCLFLFGGAMVSRIGHPSILAGIAMAPWVFWGCQRLIRRPGLGAFALAAAMVALQAFSGHPQIPVYTALAVMVYAIVLCTLRWQKTRATRDLFLPPLWVAVCLAGYAIAAIQLLPWAELSLYSPRSAQANYAFVNSDSMETLDWTLWLFPYSYGGTDRSWIQSAQPLSRPFRYGERSAYIGIAPLMLALLGLLATTRRKDDALPTPDADDDDRRYQIWSLAAAIAVMLLIAAGKSTPFSHLVYVVPVLGKLRCPARALAVAVIPLIVIAMHGLEYLQMPRAQRNDRWFRSPALAGGAVLGAMVGIVALAQIYSSATEQIAGQTIQWGPAMRGITANALAPLAWAVASVGVIVWRPRGNPRLTAPLLIAIAGLDLLSFAISYNPTVPAPIVAQTPASVDFLRRDAGNHRVAIFPNNARVPTEIAQEQLSIGWAQAFGVPEINGYNSLQPLRHVRVFIPKANDIDYGSLPAGMLAGNMNPILSMLDTQYALIQMPGNWGVGDQWTAVYQNDFVAILKNSANLGRAWFVDRVQVEPDAEVVHQTLYSPTFDPRRQAWVEGPMTPQLSQLKSDQSPAEVQVRSVSPNELHLTTSTSADRFLVLSEMWFPGWQAELLDPAGSRVLPIYRTNYLLRGIVVPAGQHVIRMVYRPTSVIAGALVTTLTLAALAAAWATTRFRRRRPSGM